MMPSDFIITGNLYSTHPNKIIAIVILVRNFDKGRTLSQIEKNKLHFFFLPKCKFIHLFKIFKENNIVGGSRGGSE